MSHTVDFRPSALKSLEKLPRAARVQVIGKIELLAGDPHAAGEAKVVGFEEIYRVREGNYRVVYTRASNRILILLVHNRKDVYRELKRQGYR